MRELEVKIVNIDLNEIEEKLKSLGAKLIAREEQKNLLIDSRDNFIKNKLNSYMRIRKTKSFLDNKIEMTLTVKKNVLNKGIRESIERNVHISNEENMLNILEMLGYRVYKEGYKKRTSYILGNIRFDLDTWDKDTYPYPYMEIEVEHKDDLEKALKILDISRENISTKSIAELSKALKVKEEKDEN